MIGLGAVGFFLFSYRLAAVNGESLAITAALLCAALAGACAGFVFHNFHPARIFMGDSGSMLIGMVLAGSALTLTGYFPAVDLAQSGSGPAPACCRCCCRSCCRSRSSSCRSPTCVLAVVRRTMKGQSPFAPDKHHLHHRLLEYGHSHRRAVW